MNLHVYEVIALVTFLILIQGLFSGSEIALLSADKLVLKKNSKTGDTRAIQALSLVSRPEEILSVTLLMTSLCTIGSSALITLYCLLHYPQGGEFIAVLTTSPLIVFFGELIPKTFFQRNADRIAPWISGLIEITYWAFFPVTRFLRLYTNRLSRIAGPMEQLLSGRALSTRDQIRTLLDYSKKESELKDSEKKMIQRILDFKNTEAKNAMIPLVRVDAIESSASLKQALESFQKHLHSRMPVYSGRIDNIIGILEMSDILTITDLENPIKNFMTLPTYVAENQNLEDLALEMRQEDSEIVVVVDEHGGAVGILTFEDIVEEIVGEISDEFDSEFTSYRNLSENSWSVQASMEIQQMNENLKIDLPEGDYETLSGFLLQQFGRIPQTRDELFFDTKAGKFRFTIQRASQRHIETVVIQKIDASRKS